MAVDDSPPAPDPQAPPSSSLDRLSNAQKLAIGWSGLWNGLCSAATTLAKKARFSGGLAALGGGAVLWLAGVGPLGPPLVAVGAFLLLGAAGRLLDRRFKLT